jgi:hypothetical protein
MIALYEEAEAKTKGSCMGPGRVLEIDSASNQARVVLAKAPERRTVWADVSLAGLPDLSLGDTVLVLGEDHGNIYVVGVLSSKKDPVPAHRITLDNGAYAQTSKCDGTQKLQVFSDKQTLLFEYDAEQGKARVDVESGDLEFRVRDGDISFNCSRNISFDGQSIEVRSRSDIRFGIISALGKMLSSMTVQRRSIGLQSPEIQMASQRGDFQIEETEYSGRSVWGRFSTVRLAADKVETLAQNIIAKAKNIYQTVEELTQLRTGRLRTLVKSTYHMKSKNAYLNAEDDFKIKADSIHLG